MVIPGEVWLTSLQASAGTTEGATPVPTETAPIRISPKSPFGRIQFNGTSLSMPGVAKWLVRAEGVKDFFAVYLGQASEADVSGTLTYPFDMTLELDESAVSGRFQGEGSTP